ncbi:hypothetical protein NEDG_02186 [Nematocida displodere]|uniref:Uncharacterized protein n=1 Tax=Nematocida displodere TaxID=1805483 RepID=A0A177EG82_9MICR|nr:hypothetical protein NEDG_02186 [Nematocida displodere]
MSSLAEIYGELYRTRPGIEAAAVSVVVAGFFCYVTYVLVLVYILPSLDRMLNGTNYSSEWTKGFVLSVCLGTPSVYSSVYDHPYSVLLVRDVILMGCFFLVSVVAGVVVLLNRRKGRLYMGIFDFCSFFMISSLSFLFWAYTKKHLKMCGGAMLAGYFLYAIHVYRNRMVGHSFDLVSPESKRHGGARKVLDWVVVFYEGEASPVSKGVQAVSPVLISFFYYLTFFPFWAGEAIVVGFVGLAVSGLLWLSTKKHRKVRDGYTMLSSVFLAKIFVHHTFSILTGMWSDSSHFVAAAAFLTVEKTYLLLVAAVFATRADRYMFAMLLTFSGFIYSFFFNFGSLLVLKDLSSLPTSLLSDYSMILIITSVVVIVANAELRSGLLEKEVGGILLLQSTIFLLLCKFKPKIG